MLLILLLLAAVSLVTYTTLDRAVGVFIASTYLLLVFSAPVIALLPFGIVILNTALFGAVLLRRYPQAYHLLHDTMQPLRKRYPRFDAFLVRVSHLLDLPTRSAAAPSTWYARMLRVARERITGGAVHTVQAVRLQYAVDWLYAWLYGTVGDTQLASLVRE